ncbi:hypothetical protein SCATT_01760 [Streptantibioticus cattleyicolor NRRL 8057 = DSM 46488]|uniref:Uncharacterized protein n=1 Tax=Streptantibioticus cattleyicolor (strain ATCC 35852 / DSM 46488 / JCM 4925 / NBRC 14057 / NRRL 8057) TaxID=1003195 RepID=G8X1L7_STREN|nr:hypothetical protein SCATT_01760 [Streptantibioticus cattleyicolor NRRL 8057 = DSM 46488]
MESVARHVAERDLHRLPRGRPCRPHRPAAAPPPGRPAATRPGPRIPHPRSPLRGDDPGTDGYGRAA